ncbi:nucleoredoxin family protein [Toxoplasma gondii RUB]|uniref:protein-disulfide reductase n=2 Tax=Toxoplasma gondii TaxID=5811 RepID=A0A086LVU4_TOXGO|nr:nucleoredoxin family protein [Toxoplasma gondii RUB]
MHTSAQKTTRHARGPSLGEKAYVLFLSSVQNSKGGGKSGLQNLLRLRCLVKLSNATPIAVTLFRSISCRCPFSVLVVLSRSFPSCFSSLFLCLLPVLSSNHPSTPSPAAPPLPTNRALGLGLRCLAPPAFLAVSPQLPLFRLGHSASVLRLFSFFSLLFPPNMSALERLLGPTLIGRGGRQVPTASIDSGVIGVYFSAHWCPPCRQFTPMLARRYQELKSLNKAFEVVFVSSDHDKASFDEYFGSMPWLSLPFDDRARKASLSQTYSVQGIPTLILIDSKGALVDRNGRQKVFDATFPLTLPDVVDAEVRGLTLEGVIDAISSDGNLSEEAKLTGYSTVVKILNNILSNPGDPKYLMLKKSNASVQARIGNRNFVKILKLAGFQETADAYKCSECPDTAKLRDVRDVVSSLMMSLS